MTMDHELCETECFAPRPDVLRALRALTRGPSEAAHTCRRVWLCPYRPAPPAPLFDTGTVQKKGCSHE